MVFHAIADIGIIDNCFLGHKNSILLQASLFNSNFKHSQFNFVHYSLKMTEFFFFNTKHNENVYIVWENEYGKYANNCELIKEASVFFLVLFHHFVENNIESKTQELYAFQLLRKKLYRISGNNIILTLLTPFSVSLFHLVHLK